ncbi:YIP1 family protein [Marinococcus sp. PL1-022]|uniref:YIP1 family protein n=1 Tax=Marinococcus sp. PL1-022 TaxID=3095363 RepID=UPI0029C2331A|nr:YIP1 family protein [Marinococcus sp. PL1-022]MDX6151544.1 YIP1 family protein [Marinococcus sp. PL1-022]
MNPIRLLPLFTAPRKTYRQISDNPGLHFTALWIVIIAGLSQSLAQNTSDMSPIETGSALSTFLTAVGIIAAFLLFQIVTFYLNGLILKLVILMFQGRIKAREARTVYGLSLYPQAFLFPFIFLLFIGKLAGGSSTAALLTAIASAIIAAASIWGIVMQVNLISAASGFSGGKSFGVFVVFALLLALLIFILVLLLALIVIFIAGAFSN